MARRRADAVDLVLISLFRRAEHQMASGGRYRESGLAVVAVGGYGRRELCPYSDIDLMILYREEEAARVQGVAECLFYPLWDAGLELGHGARTVEECLEVATENIELQTSFFQARLLVGDQELFRRFVDGLRAQVLADGGRAFISGAQQARAARHRAFGPAAALLEPHLKEGRGGLRDVHEALWLTFALRGTVGFDGLQAAGWLSPDALSELEHATDVLLRARTALHHVMGRKVDRLYLEFQEEVAARMRPAARDGTQGVGAVMAQIFAAAQSVALVTEDVWQAALREAGLSGAWRPALLPEALPETADGRRTLLLSLMQAGTDGLPALERLSHRGVLSAWIPGWEAIRSLGQRDSLHTYTVDGHALRCVASAVQLLTDHDEDPVAGALAVEMQGAPAWEALRLGCLLHDVGKGLAADNHAQAGASLAGRAVAALGEPQAVQEEVAFLVREHLLLADTASRRDLDDPALLSRLAEAIGSARRLQMLYVLTVADSMSTGPSVWSPWTAGLVRELFFKLLRVLDEAAEPAARPEEWGEVEVPAGSEVTLVVPAGPQGAGLTLRVRPTHLTGVDELSVVSAPVAGVLARVSGVLAYHGINILSAQVQPGERGRVVQTFHVADYFGDVVEQDRWELVRADVARALEGRLSLDYRLAEKAARYAAGGGSDRQEPPRVVVDNTVSEALTVIEVHAADRVGLLYTLARALDDLRLEVRLAKVATLKDRVVDAFYVADAWGRKLVDPEHVREVERAILFALGRDM
ncbi:MAG: [protein-PII] uridylyltransferase [Thermoleophilia bacterium]